MTHSSDPADGASFGSFDALTRPEAERRSGGRRLQDRIAQREAEQVENGAALAAALPLFGGVERRRPQAVDRRSRDPLSADRLEPLPSKPSYARFIPREEVGTVGNWHMNNFGGPAKSTAAAAAAAPVDDPAEVAEKAAALAARQAAEAAQARADEVRRARDGGYQDGHRDGLVALDAFKQSHASQTTAQFAVVLKAFEAQLAGLEQDLATRVAGIAMAVARQVVRQELQTRPEGVVEVTREALGLMMSSARHIVVRVHPDDHALLASGLGDLLTARHARLNADARIERGGCIVQSDIGSVDASVAMRWQRAMAAMGADHAWQAETPTAPAAVEPDPTASIDLEGPA